MEAFKEEYDCICRFFIEDDKYYSLKKVPEYTHWIDHLDTIEEKDRIVLMNDKKGISHSFVIKHKLFKESTYIVVFTDITSTMQESFSLKDKVLHDKLTGAYNREFFEKNVSRTINFVENRDTHLGVIFFDIDNFKKINDTHGHNAGDHVLMELVDVVHRSIRSSDYLIRWGGEEFVVLLFIKSLDEAYKSAEHLRTKIEEYKFSEPQHVTCSFGVTLYKTEETIDQTLKRADKALYTSKHHGRNRVTKI